MTGVDYLLIFLGVFLFAANIYVSNKESVSCEAIIKKLKKGDSLFKSVIDGNHIQFKQASEEYVIEDIDLKTHKILLKNVLTSRFKEVSVADIRKEFSDSNFQSFFFTLATSKKT